MLKLRENARWSLVVPTSMGVRLCPPDGAPVGTGDLYHMHVTSAETNVASISSYLGEPVKVLTTFVKDSPIAACIKSNLRARGMDFEGKDVPQGGPWGYRHQFNIADSGMGSRGPRVCNDRAGEVGRTLNSADFDLDRIFGAEGVKILHASGLIGALSPDTSRFCLDLARAAKKNGTLFSFDLNYRASFWAGREAELSAAFKEFAETADILVGNEEDFQLALGVTGPEAGGVGLAGKIDGFKGMIGEAAKRFPNVKLFATTLREVVNANEHIWGAILYDAVSGEWHIAEPRPIRVLDRIGGGDGFVGGLLYGILRGWESERCLQFGWASGALATTFLTDYAQPADEDMVWSVWSGNARVKR